MNKSTTTKLRRAYAKALVLILVLMSSSLYAEITHQHYRFYKNFKSYAMGGAGIIQNGSAMTMFSNPANLRNLPRGETQWELFNTIASVGDKSSQFVSDLSDATSGGTEQEKNRKTFDVFNKYQGQNLSFGLSFTPVALAYHSDFYGIDALGVGLITSIRGDMRTHNGFGSAGILEVNNLNYTGLVYGIASDFEDFTVGINFKLMRYFALQKSYTVDELIDDNLPDNIRNNDLKEGTSMALDIGLVWEALQGDGWSLETGFVVSNLGGIGDSKLTGAYIPATLDLGMKALYDIPYIPITFALDFIDLSGAYEDEKDLKKRLNYGLDVRLLQTDYISFGIQGGVHQSKATYGGDLLLFDLIHLGYASYSEELGVFAGQDPSHQDLYYFSFSF